MSEITTVGLDLAKRVVSLCGEDAGGRVVVQRPLRREAVLGWFVRRPPCLVGMEACASAHGFARELAALGHTARIIAPEFVRPFRLSGKNDANDAAAICVAVRQPQLRFVTVKSAEQQARLVVHRLRRGWQEERTAGLNRLRGLLAEFGRVYAATTNGQTHAACTWLTWRPHHEADVRMRAQRAVSSMARARIDRPSRPDTELQSVPSSTRKHLHSQGSPYSAVRPHYHPASASEESLNCLVDSNKKG
jgi:transposase